MTGCPWPGPFSETPPRDGVGCGWQDVRMPEMPEVQGLVDFLDERAVGRTIVRTTVAAIAALKTYDPPNTALHGVEITSATRRGKFVVLSCGAELHLVFHLAKAGW